MYAMLAGRERWKNHSFFVMIARRSGSLCVLVRHGPAAGAAPLTTNGIQPSGPGYRRLAQRVEDNRFGAPRPWRPSTQSEPHRPAIITKNEWFLHPS
ncbi:MAG: hypothetical protein ACKOTF_04105, partial [Opitutaceae bacterium]